VKSNAATGSKPDAKKVVKASTNGATGSKPEFKKKAKTGEAGSDKEGKKKSFKPKPKAKKPMTPEERKMAKPHYKLVRSALVYCHDYSLLGLLGLFADVLLYFQRLYAL
jgi:hypothetical protein